MFVGSNDNISDLISRLENSADQMLHLVEGETHKSSKEETDLKVSDQRSKLTQPRDEKSLRELFESSSQIPQELSDLQYQLEHQADVNDKVYARALKVLETLKYTTGQIIGTWHEKIGEEGADSEVSALMESQIALSTGIHQEVVLSQQKLEEAFHKKKLRIEDFEIEPRIIEQKKGGIWAWWTAVRKTQYRFSDRFELEDQKLDLKQETADIFNGIRVNIKPMEISSHGLTEVGPNGFCVDIKRLGSFIFNSKAYIYTLPHTKEKFPAQLIAELKNTYGTIGAERIMRVCNQASLAQPLVELHLLYLNESVKKNPDKGIGFLNTTPLQIDLDRKENVTTITLNIVFTNNPSLGVEPKEGEKEEADDKKWGEFIIFKKVITIPNEELIAPESDYPNLHVEDSFSFLLDDRQTALNLLERF